MNKNSHKDAEGAIYINELPQGFATKVILQLIFFLKSLI